MLFIAVGLTSCTKEQAELSTTPTASPAKQRLSPMVTAQFLRYVALSKQGNLQNARFESFPNIPVELSKDLFDEVLAVYVPLKKEQPGGLLTERLIANYTLGS